ncbi:MAG: Asp-tRNA(Asn)/Glu-tRNA(Gln) amidotransferase subunit GatC [Candidatus Paceibacterota bacterium]
MINVKDIQDLAKLARVEIKDEEAISLTKELDSILEYVGQIKEVSLDLQKEKPLLKNVMREDIPTNTSREFTEDILANSPKTEGDYIEVKNIL